MWYKWKVAIVISALLGGTSTFASPESNTGSATSPPPYQSQPDLDRSDEFSDQAVEQFAAAYSRIFTIQQDLASRLKGIENRDEAKQMQREAQDEMLSVVKAQGMSVEDYNEVVAAMQADIVLRNRILDEMDP